MNGPIIHEVTSVGSHTHGTQYPINSQSASNSWKSSITPAIAPVVPVLLPPIVVSPSDLALDPGIRARLLPQQAPTNGCVEAPAVPMTTRRRGRVLRPITGRGHRDQLTTTSNDVMVSIICLSD